MLKTSDQFDRHFCRALALLPDNETRMRFMYATIGCLEHCVGEAQAIECMDAALGISQGVGAALVPQEQEAKLFLVKR